MRTLVTGATGYLGAELVRELRRRDRDVRALVRSPQAASRLDGTGAEIVAGDVLDPASLEVALDGVTRVFHMAGVVGHRAADEPKLRAVNVDGARNVLAACARAGVERVVFTSSVATVGPAGGPGHPRDEGAWLVDGDDGREDFRYGRTKAAGEQAVLTSGADAYVVRTAWLYGQVGGNFVKTMAHLAQTRETVNVVDDQVGAPTWTLHLARALVALGIADVAPGIWHCTNAGEASWYIFARAIFAEMGLDPARVHPTTSEEFIRPAPRPAYSVLSTEKWQRAGLPELPHWRDALHEAFETLDDELYG